MIDTYKNISLLFFYQEIGRGGATDKYCTDWDLYTAQWSRNTERIYPFT